MADSFVEIAEGFYGVPERSYRPRREGFVYFAQRGQHGPIKIGWSVNPRKRVSALRSSSGEEIRLLKVEWTSKRRERELHERFAPCRIRGEWYAPVPELLAEAGIGSPD